MPAASAALVGWFPRGNGHGDGIRDGKGAGAVQGRSVLHAYATAGALRRTVLRRVNGVRQRVGLVVGRNPSSQVIKG